MFALSTLPVEELIRDLDENGAVSLCALSDESRQELLAEAEQARFRAARESVGEGDRVVFQRMEVCDRFSAASLFFDLRDGFQSLWDASFASVHPYPFESPVRFNDLMLQRYTKGELGITPHRDSSGYRNIICLFVLDGQGRFFVSDDRKGKGAQEIPNVPGDLVITRAPGFLHSDARPFHFVSDITETRYVFGLRHERR
jgi:hypothetical protein